MSYKVIIVGASGNIGREIVSILAERNFPIKEIVGLATGDSVGKQISFNETNHIVIERLDTYNDFKENDIVFMAAGSKASEQYTPLIANRGAIVIDNSSLYRMDEDVPLIVPEVNPEALSEYTKRRIIANPNCSTIQMVVPLKPLHDKYKIQRIVAATYQAVSGRGKRAMDELYDQTKKIYEASTQPPKEFQRRIAFNCIPQIDVFLDNGDNKEEWKMKVETKKILDKSIEVCATCVRVPVFNCHAEAVNVQFEKAFDLEEAIDILYQSEGVTIHHDEKHTSYVTQIDCSKDDNVHVCRIRRDNTVPNGLNMWIVSDNLRKGGALNAVQIAELLINDYL